VTKEALLVTKEALLVTKEALLVTKEALLVTKEALLMTKEAFLPHEQRCDQDAYLDATGASARRDAQARDRACLQLREHLAIDTEHDIARLVGVAARLLRIVDSESKLLEHPA
jgi:hypothetical protein